MKKVVIIGAGISGLAAGIYARQSGLDVTIYESHSIAGGASTSWRRKGYLFEGGLHWLTGSAPDQPLNKVWRELGALNDQVPILNRDPFSAYECEGTRVYLYRDLEKLHAHFLEIAPEDKKEIDRLCKDIRKFRAFNMPITDIKGVKARHKSTMPISAIFSMLPALTRISFYAKQSCQEYASRFQNKALRFLLENVVGPEYYAPALAVTLATFTTGDGGYPVGGSLAMAERMAQKFKALGGTIVYKTAVEKVVVENGTAKGIRLADDSVIHADTVIVTPDTLVAIDRLFDTPIHEPWAEQMRKNTVPVLNTFISLGIEADLSDLPEHLTFTSDKALVCGDQAQTVIGINQYANHKGYAPEGCTALTAIVDGDTYAYWAACKANGTYEAEKEKLAQAFIEILAQKFPQTAGKIAVWDVATPLTYERYLGSYKGSWMSIVGKGSKMTRYPTQPESIRNVYFAGQRLTPPGGLPGAVETGRRAAQYVCRDTDTVFQGALSE